MFAHYLLTALLAGAPIPAGGKAPEPIATIHFASIERLEKDFFRLMQSLPMPNKETAVQQMQDELKRMLGEKGWDGLDTKKPGTGYIVFDEKNPEKSYGFLVLPITDEKNALDFLVRFGKSQNESNEVVPLEGVTGVYKLKGKSESGPSKHVRMLNGYCYFGINAPLESFAADKLLPAEKTLDPKETALVAVTVHVKKLPKEWTARGLQEFETTAKGGIELLPGNGPQGSLKNTLGKAIELIPKYVAKIQEEGETFGLRLRYEDDLAYEFFLKGKTGTTLANDIAVRPATTNQFARLITEKAVGGLMFKVPVLNDDLKSLASTAVTDFYKHLLEKDPPEAADKAVLDQIVPRLATTLKKGDLDFATALHGPDAKGSYTAVAGLALDDAVGLTPELKKLISAKAEGIIEWDAAEEAGVKIHTANVVPLLPAEAMKLFGNKATCHFALTKQGAILALGNDSLAEVKRGIGLKAVPAAVMDMKVNFSKLPKVIEHYEPRAAEQIGIMLGKADKLASLNSVTVTGGKELRISIVSGIAAFASWFTARVGH